MSHPLPHWRSTKTYQAAPVIAIDRAKQSVSVDLDGRAHVVTVPPDFFNRGTPAGGDFLLIYPDGYMSWCPRAKHLEACVRIETPVTRSMADTLGRIERIVHPDATAAEIPKLEDLGRKIAGGAPDYLAMSAGAMLQAVGDDASKWATAFCQIAAKLGVTQKGAPIDEAWMIGWFANAIEHSSAVRRWAREKAELAERPQLGLNIAADGQETLVIELSDDGAMVSIDGRAGGGHRFGPWSELTLRFHSADGTSMTRTYRGTDLPKPGLRAEPAIAVAWAEPANITPEDPLP